MCLHIVCRRSGMVWRIYVRIVLYFDKNRFYFKFIFSHSKSCQDGLFLCESISKFGLNFELYGKHFIQYFFLNIKLCKGLKTIQNIVFLEEKKSQIGWKVSDCVDINFYLGYFLIYCK